VENVVEIAVKIAGTRKKSGLSALCTLMCAKEPNSLILLTFDANQVHPYTPFSVT
jgi:hypothetical protein